MSKHHKKANKFDDSDSIEIKIEESDNEEKQEKIDNSDELITKNSELQDLLKRKTAEFENYKQRTDKEKAVLLEFGAERVFKKLVDLLDDIRNADESIKNTKDIEAIKKGLDMILQKAEKLFADESVTMMPTKIGDEFDVNMHEALMQQPSDTIPAGRITMILQNGYLMKDKVIRYAKVATSSGNNSDN